MWSCSIPGSSLRGWWWLARRRVTLCSRVRTCGMANLHLVTQSLWPSLWRWNPNCRTALRCWGRRTVPSLIALSTWRNSDWRCSEQMYLYLPTSCQWVSVLVPAYLLSVSECTCTCLPLVSERMYLYLPTSCLRVWIGVHLLCPNMVLCVTCVLCSVTCSVRMYIASCV